MQMWPGKLSVDANEFLVEVAANFRDILNTLSGSRYSLLNQSDRVVREISIRMVPFYLVVGVLQQTFHVNTPLQWLKNFYRWVPEYYVQARKSPTIATLLTKSAAIVLKGFYRYYSTEALPLSEAMQPAFTHFSKRTNAARRLLLRK